VLHRYEGCRAPLIHYEIRGGGHAWPGSGGSALLSMLVGETNRDISATREIEAFLEALAGRD
jgi:Poly(3-hydroxybutyrate) depolymerase